MLIIRELSPEDDFDAVADIYVKSWQSAYRGIVPGRFLEKLNTSRWSGTLRAEPEASLGAFVDGRIIGTAYVGSSRDEAREGYGEIVSLYLLPQHTGRGFGRTLITAALQKLRQEGYGDICLWALKDNMCARGFYEHMGFRLTGRKQTETIGGRSLVEVEYIIAYDERA